MHIRAVLIFVLAAILGIGSFVPTLVHVLVNVAAAQEATPNAASGDFAELVDIGGRELFLICTGSGRPTVILEAGSGGGVERPLTSQIAKTVDTRVCAYDRANIGGSDKAPLPRSGADVVTDLHTLLDAADVPGPYVLVGASLGGLFTRLYASTYPDDVVGMVLLDASHEDQDVRSAEMVGPDLWRAYEEKWAADIDDEGFFPAGTLSDALEAEVREAQQTSSLRPMPLIVITIEEPCDASCFPEGWPVDADNAMWRELQEAQTALVPGGRLLVSKYNQHYLQQADPALVTEAVKQVVDAVRDPSTWPAS